MASDKTEKPTPKKRRDAQEKGQIARSKDLSAAMVLLGAVLMAGFGGSFLLSEMQHLVRTFWKEFLLDDLTNLATEGMIRVSVLSVMKLAGPLVVLTVLLGFGSSLTQGGLVISGHGLKPKFTGLNPKNNLKKIFSKQGIVQLLKSSFLVLVVGWIGYDSINDIVGEVPSLALMNVRSIAGYVGSFLFSVIIKVALFLLVIGALDFAFQKYKFEEDLKQTKEEVKEDFKQTEGNPLIKGRIRRLQREMARKRMMASVPEADVVITNPTEYAVALKYDMEEMAAPQVLAKGRGFTARRIKELAGQHNIPTVENVPLAQALFRSAEVGDEIPGELFRAVAEVLAYVFSLKENNWH